MSKKFKFSSKCVVFTNLAFLLVNDLRVWCKALILSEDRARWDRQAETRLRLVAYGSTCAWKVMDVGVDTFTYTLGRIKNRPTWKLKVGDLTIEIDVENHDFDVGVEAFEIHTDDVDELSRHHAATGEHVLDRACFNQRAPNIGGAVFGPPEQMRAILAKFS